MAKKSKKVITTFDPLTAATPVSPVSAPAPVATPTPAVAAPVSTPTDGSQLSFGQKRKASMIKTLSLFSRK